MARTKIQGQDRLGPADSRARVFSTFSPQRVDQEAGKTAQNIGEALDAAANFVGQRQQNELIQSGRDQIRAARQESREKIEGLELAREQGLRDFINNRVQDGQAIAAGEMSPLESQAYMTGVAMARGRRRGREVWAEFYRLRNENERPGLEGGNYQEWMDTLLDEAKANVGVVDEEMSEAEYGEFTGIVSQMRYRDSESYLAQLDREAAYEAAISRESDIEGLTLEYDPGSETANEDFLASAEGIMTEAYTDGEALPPVRMALLESAYRIALDTGDETILTSIPDSSPMMDNATKDARDRMIDSIQSAREEAIAERSDRLLRDGNAMLRRFEVSAAIDDETHPEHYPIAQLMTDLNQLRAQGISDDDFEDLAEKAHDHHIEYLDEAVERRNAQTDLHNRNYAATQSVNRGEASFGAYYRDHNNELVRMTPQEISDQVAEGVLSSGAPINQAFAVLSDFSLRNGMQFDEITQRIDNIFGMSTARIGAVNGMTPQNRSDLAFLATLNPEVMTMHAQEAEDTDTLLAFQHLLQATGADTEGLLITDEQIDEDPTRTLNNRREEAFRQAADAFVMARRSGNVRVDQDMISNSTSYAIDFFDDRATQAEQPGEGIAGWFNNQRNLDGDAREEFAIWATKVGTQAARLAELPDGGRLRDQYLENVFNNTMIINRRPVTGTAVVRGEPGRAYTMDLTADIVRTIFAPSMRANPDADMSAYLAALDMPEDFDLGDEANLDRLVREVQIEDVPGGKLWRLDSLSFYLPNEDFNVGFQQWSPVYAERAAMRDRMREEEALASRYNDPAFSYRAMESFMIRNSDRFQRRAVEVAARATAAGLQGYAAASSAASEALLQGGAAIATNVELARTQGARQAAREEGWLRGHLSALGYPEDLVEYYVENPEMQEVDYITRFNVPYENPDYR